MGGVRAAVRRARHRHWMDAGLRMGNDEFDWLVSERRLAAVFQPVVVLDTGQVIGYEALIRGPEGSAFARPDVLFAHAYRVNRVAELDWVCRAAAFRDAIAAGLPVASVLLVNVEPASLRAPCPPDLAEVIDAGRDRFRVVLELTERAIASDPAALVEAVWYAHSSGMGIAIDDVGAAPASLAMMPLLDPDLIKLDLSLVQAHANPVQAKIVNAVLAEAERTGATILAEGIETAAQVETAGSMGAVLGQGWYFGAPTPRPPPPVHVGTYPPRPPLTESGPHETPYQIVVRTRESRVATGQLLASLSRRIEREGSHPGEPAIVLASFQHVRNIDPPTRARYQRLARRATLVAAFGEAMPPRPVTGVRGTPVAPDDPLAGEWVVIVIRPHFAAALVAIERDHDDQGAGSAPVRRFEFAITHSRELVIAAARPLLHRMHPLPATPADHNPQSES